MKKHRRVGRGKRLVELVKGSREYTLDAIRRAFRKQFPTEDGLYYPWLVETFADHVVVNSEDLEPDEYYYIPYQKEDGGYVFVERGKWEVVELTYQARSVEESRGAGEKGRRRFVERVEGGGMELLEASEDGGPRRMRAVGITADVVNGNGRRYPAAVLRAAVEELGTHLHESAGQGRALPLLGEAEHPSDKSGRPNLLETVVKWEAVEFDGSLVLLEGLILPTSKGKDILALMEGGVMPGVSQRAYGESKYVGKRGQRVEEVTALTITGYDLVLEPSDPVAGVTMIESEEETEMDLQAILEALQAEGFLDKMAVSVRQNVLEAMRADDEASKEKALREALGIGADGDLAEAVLGLLEQRTPGEMEAGLRERLGIGETEDVVEAVEAREKRLGELEEAERQRQVGGYIAEQVAELKYPDWLQVQMTEAVVELGPKSVEEAKTVIAAKKKEYGAIMAKVELAAKGFGGLKMLAPVLEREMGVPEFARGSHLLTEAMVNSGLAKARKWNRATDELSSGERYAKLYLEKFDKAFKRELMAEALSIEEAEQTSDLSLPYSVARAVIAEAIPELVAASIFDLGMTDQSPSRIYYEAYSGETGASADVTDEEVTITALDTWYALAHQRLQPGTAVVTNEGGGTTYTEGTDYVIDYGNGKVRGLTGGGITALDVVKVDYTYDAVREGEMAAIQRAKMTLTYKTLEIAADRLATEISTEAVVFAKSQLGWDATARTLAGLVRKIRELIDKHLLYQGLSAALSVANNSGGTWSATPGGGDTYDQNLDKLFRYIGVAKVKVANRFYRPDFVLASGTMGDVISNSEQFTAAGKRPDSDLNAAGFVGRVKGLPLFESTQFTDSYILVGNRELVMHRVFKPMVLKGPYPSYSSNKLVASEQFYAEEFNGTDAPVTEKGATVKLTS